MILNINPANIGNVGNNFNFNDPFLANALRQFHPTTIGRFNQKINQTGVSLFEGFPGRVFDRGNGVYSYNTGTSRNGSYVPGFFFKNGQFIPDHLRPANEAPSPTNSFETAKAQLDLKDNGDGTFCRNGWEGKYTKRADGAVIYHGGNHRNNGRPIYCPPQVYIDGHWYRPNDPNAAPRVGGGDIDISNAPRIGGGDLDIPPPPRIGNDGDTFTGSSQPPKIAPGGDDVFVPNDDPIQSDPQPLPAQKKAKSLPPAKAAGLPSKALKEVTVGPNGLWVTIPGKYTNTGKDSLVSLKDAMKGDNPERLRDAGIEVSPIYFDVSGKIKNYIITFSKPGNFQIASNGPMDRYKEYMNVNVEETD